MGKPMYVLNTGEITAGASKLFCDLFNAPAVVFPVWSYMADCAFQRSFFHAPALLFTF